MRNLRQDEIEHALDDNGEAEDGAVAVEATVQELADLGVGTCCGTARNQAFKAMADAGFQHRICRGWFDDKHKVVLGMFHVKMQTDRSAEKLERVSTAGGGSLRYNGDSMWIGFKEFEIE